MTRRKVILLSSAHTTLGGQYLGKLAEEIDKLDELLLPAERKGYLQRSNIDRATLHRLHNRFVSFSQDPVSIFHFCGHSSPGKIILEGDGDDIQEVPIENFAEFLSSQVHIEVIFLNSCYSSCLGEKILTGNGNIKAVIETTAPVGDERASRFAQWFYEALISPDGKSLKEAFQHASALFKSKYEVESFPDTSRGIAFRDKGGGFMYRLSFRNPQAESWRLIQMSNLKLYWADKIEHDFRIFSLYAENQKGVYRDLRNLLDGKKVNDKEIVVNGLWDIEETGAFPDREAIQKECSAANVLLFLIHDGDFKELWREMTFLEALARQSQRKKIFIRVSRISEVKELLYRDHHLLSDAEFPQDMFEKIGLETISDAEGKLGKLDALRWMVNFDILPFLQQLKVDPKVLKEELEELDFDEQRRHYSNRFQSSTSHFNFVLIEGSPFCAHYLLVKRLKRLLYPTLIRTPVLPPIFFESDSNVTEEIQSVEDIWNWISLNVFNFSSRNSTDIWSSLHNRLNNQDVVLTFEQIGGRSPETVLKNKKLLLEFWKNLIQLASNGQPPTHRLFIFALNQSHNPQADFQDLRLDCPNLRFHTCILRPIKKLEYAELNTWHGDKVQKINQEEFLYLMRDHGVRIVPDNMANVINNICSIFNYPNLAVEILSP